MKIQSTKNKSNFGKKLQENLPKYLHIDFQIWFLKEGIHKLRKKQARGRGVSQMQMLLHELM